MNKCLLRIVALCCIITILPSCGQKEWWEDCYASEEEARLDYLEVDFANTQEENDKKIEDLESRIDDLETQLEELQDEISSMRRKVREI